MFTSSGIVTICIDLYILLFSSNKAGLFYGSFFLGGGGQFDPPAVLGLY